ncbi:MAG: Npun_F0494 family protein [Synechococcaceae cyanobacterium]
MSHPVPSGPPPACLTGIPSVGESATTAGSLRRARQSLRCLPFRRAFYEEVDQRAISAAELCARADWSQLVFAPFGVDRAEAHFRWLILLGVLRREVDGQGLTERVRLTPMGRSLLVSWQGEVPRAGLRERIRENFRRHRPRF